MEAESLNLYTFLWPAGGDSSGCKKKFKKNKNLLENGTRLMTFMTCITIFGSDYPIYAHLPSLSYAVYAHIAEQWPMLNKFGL